MNAIREWLGLAKAQKYAKPRFLLDHEDILAEQERRFAAVDDIVQMAVSGDARAVIISGPPGVGKTYSVEQAFRGQRRVRFKSVKGFTRATGLFTLMHQYRGDRDRIVIDDCDSAFSTEESLNLLKAALDSTDDARTISWRTQATLKYDEGEDEVKVPKEFDFNGGIVFLTNLDFEAQQKHKDHLQAIMSRAYYIDIGIRTPVEQLVRVINVCWSSDAPQRMGMDEETANEVYQFMIDHQTRLREISIRMAQKILKLASKKPKKWRALAEVTCLRPAAEKPVLAEVA